MADDTGRTWERDVLEKVALAAITEQRRSRRWGIFFKIVGFAYLTFILVALWGLRGGGGAADASGRHTALISLEGTIQARGGVGADRVIESLQQAFADKGTQGVILKINSPGGSAVQAGIIYDEIQRLRAKHPNTPIYTVIEDTCASGGYYVAAATDRIYVDKASLVGSIGVLMNSFGFTGTMDKLGVERRLYTAGENKGFLDPFSPVDPKQKAHVEGLLGDIHQQFIDAVKKGRGTRLKSDDPTIFSGLIWTGARSVELGLADALGSVDYVAREVVKAETVVDYTRGDNVAERLAKRFGASAADTFADVLSRVLETR
jgi:protease-4